jgi:THO complex subunit 1
MAVLAEDSQSTVIARLDYLLQRARHIKPSATIDPPLQVSDLISEDELLIGHIEGEDEARKLAVDSAAKSLFYANLVSPSHPSLVYSTHVFRDRLGLESPHS